MPENMVKALTLIADDFRAKLLPWNNAAMVNYMLRRAGQFLIPGSY